MVGIDALLQGHLCPGTRSFLLPEATVLTSLAPEVRKELAFNEPLSKIASGNGELAVLW